MIKGPKTEVFAKVEDIQDKLGWSVPEIIINVDNLAQSFFVLKKLMLKDWCSDMQEPMLQPCQNQCAKARTCPSNTGSKETKEGFVRPTCAQSNG